MQGVSDHDVFCDYLTVTCNPENSFIDRVEDFICSRLVTRCQVEDQKTLIRFSGPHGVPALIRIDRDFHKRVDRIMFGGASLEVLRIGSLLSHLVQELCSVPNNVTRVDVAHDVTLSNASEYSDILLAVVAAGHDGKISLSRKSILPHKVKPMIAPRGLDNVMSGSVMFNHRSDRYSGIVYDKTAQLFDKFSVVIPENIFRYEMRTTDGTLRDVIDPDPLFFSMASPDLLPCPPNVPIWTKLELAPLNLEPLPQLTDWQRLQKIIDTSIDLEALVEILQRSSPATVSMVRKRLNARLDVSLDAEPPWARKTA